MLRRVLTMVAYCDRCKNVSKVFSFVSMGGSNKNALDATEFFEHLPFGWANWSGWGSYDQDRTHLICPECAEKVKVSGEGTLRISEKSALDGLAEL